MTTETLLSQQISLLDLIPPVRLSGGYGSAALLQSVYGVVTPTSGSTNPSLYKMARVPTRSLVKHVLIDFAGTVTAFTCDITLYYSDSTMDGTLPANQGQLVNSLSGASSLIAHNLNLSGQTADAIVDVTNMAGNFGPADRNQELWKAAGLAVDPGGFFDFVIVCTDTQNTSTFVLGLEVQYVVPS